MDLKPNPRLDEWLVEQGHYQSRSRAREAIRRGCITINGKSIEKPSTKVTRPDAIKIDDDASGLVSRAALKLIAALKETDLSPDGKICLDIGASTGGFCQVLIENGARHVYAIDVGHDQMDEGLLEEAKLTNIEGLNARMLSANDLDNVAPEFLTCDVSFISLKLALPPALELAAPGALGIFLVKPQFEVGKEKLGKGGIVRDAALLAETVEDIRGWFETQKGWHMTHLLPSPIHGGDGNQEYLLVGRKDD